MIHVIHIWISVWIIWYSSIFYRPSNREIYCSYVLVNPITIFNQLQVDSWNLVKRLPFLPTSYRRLGMTRMHTFWSFVSGKCAPSESQRVRHQTALELTFIWNNCTQNTRKMCLKRSCDKCAENTTNTTGTHQCQWYALCLLFTCTALCTVQCTMYSLLSFDFIRYI